MSTMPGAAVPLTSRTTTKPIRLAVVGGRRGQAFHTALGALEDLIELRAVCDTSPAVLTNWAERHPDARTHSSYDSLLADDQVDAVFLATPLKLHAHQAIAALDAGKHVLSEVVANYTIDEAWALVESVERSGRTYMLAENYCYMRPNMIVRGLADAGELGRLTYLEGAYIHDCRHLLHLPDGSPTWRAALRTEVESIYYPTHSLGPLAQWLRAANGADDRLDQVSGFATPVAAVPEYFTKQFGADHPGASAKHWRQGDSGTAVITTSSGAVLTIRVDAVSPRPHNMTHYAAQGTNGAYEAARRDTEDPLVWIAGRSEERSRPGSDHPDRPWDSLWNYAAQYDDQRWRDHLSVAQQTGHGGGDLFVLREFAQAIQDGRDPEIDVYDAVTWSSTIALSAESMANNHRPAVIPRFDVNRKQS